MLSEITVYVQIAHALSRRLVKARLEDGESCTRTIGSLVVDFWRAANSCLAMEYTCILRTGGHSGPGLCQLR